MFARKLLTALAALTFLALLVAPTAVAHASQNSSDGKVRITWGWQTEPMYAGEKVILDLVIRDAATMAGIGGITPANITELSLHYGEEEYELGDITAYRGAKTGGFGGDGNYTGANRIYLTKPGIYTLHIKGTIAGSDVDLEIPAAHETKSVEELAFPAGEDADDVALESRLAALEAEVAALKAKAATQSQTPTSVVSQTPAAPAKDVPASGLLLAAIAGVGAALILRRK